MDLNVKVIGAGGIGLCLLDPLCRVLNFGSPSYSFGNVEIAIVDGDDYEENNKSRQGFKKRGNKAQVKVDELKEQFYDVIFRAHPTYLDTHNIDAIIKNKDFVMMCVDNHKSRKLVSDHCETLNDVTLISGGNDYTDGNMQVFVRRGGVNRTLPIANSFHKEIQNPADKHPSEIVKREGCLEQAVSEPQLLISNFKAASLMLCAFHRLLVDPDNFDYDEAYFDIMKNACVPQDRMRRPNKLAEQILSKLKKEKV